MLCIPLILAASAINAAGGEAHLQLVLNQGCEDSSIGTDIHAELHGICLLKDATSLGCLARSSQCCKERAAALSSHALHQGSTYLRIYHVDG